MKLQTQLKIVVSLLLGGALIVGCTTEPSGPEAVYNTSCAGCHGKEGKGEGPAAPYISPPPRDFTSGVFKFGGALSEIEKTIARGIPTTSMPAFSKVLTEEEIKGLASFVRDFTGEPAPQEVAVPEVPSGIGSAEKGKAMFAEHCARCHEGEDRLVALGEVRPQLKGGERPEDIYRRITQGIPKTPSMESAMPAFGDKLSEAAVWDLVAYVRSLRPEGKEEAQGELMVRRVESLPKTASASAWEEVSGLELFLQPTRERPLQPERLTIKALHDGEHLAIVLDWPDVTAEQEIPKVAKTQYLDSAAFMVPRQEGVVPFIGMGNSGELTGEPVSVGIWQWRAREGRLGGPSNVQRLEESQAEEQFLTREMPVGQPGNLTGRDDPFLESLSPEERRMFENPGLASGNPLSKPIAQQNVLKYTASGIGALEPVNSDESENESAQIRGRGTWGNDRWRVLMTGPLEEGELSLAPGRKTFAAFAVWNGAAQDRAGQKSITHWIPLEVEQ